MASEMVIAWGDNGLEPTPREDVVEIPVAPLGEGNTVTPQFLRWLGRANLLPTRIRRIRRPREGQRFVSVEFDRASGDWSSCAVRNLVDARDPLFAGLTPRERARIERAVLAAEAAA